MPLRVEKHVPQIKLVSLGFKQVLNQNALSTSRHLSSLFKAWRLREFISLASMKEVKKMCLLAAEPVV